MPNEISHRTTPTNNIYANLPAINSDIGTDVIVSRRLAHRALQQGDLPSALAFAKATSSLLTVAVKKQLRTNDLLLAPAVLRTSKLMVEAISNHLSHVHNYTDIVDMFAAEFTIENH